MSSPTGSTGDGSLAARSLAPDAGASALARVTDSRTVWESARSFWDAVRHAWRRSIQMRVVVATVALSVSVIAILGFVLMNLVRGGLLDAKEDSALSEAYAGLSVAQLTVNNSDASDAAGIDVLMQDLSQDLAQRSSRGRLYAVVVLSSSSNRNQEIPPEERASSFVRRESVPRDLRAAVAAEPGSTTSTRRSTTRTAASSPDLLSEPSLMSRPPVRTGCTTCFLSPRKSRRSAWSAESSPSAASCSSC